MKAAKAGGIRFMATAKHTRNHDQNPALHARKPRMSTADSTTDTTIEPRQPRRLEKNTNIADWNASGGPPVQNAGVR